MKKEKHSDKLDFVSNLRVNEFLIILLITVSIAMIFGLEKTGSTVRIQTPTEITIVADKWKFTPNEIKVREGDRLRFKLMTSEVNESFGFKLSSFMYNKVVVIEPNKTKYVDVVASRQGIFRYRCEKPCGWGKNLMIGKLIVE